MEGGVSFFLFDGSMYVLVMVVVDVVLMAVWTSGWLGGSTASTLSVVAVTYIRQWVQRDQGLS